jgi:hypothetical protein
MSYYQSARSTVGGSDRFCAWRSGCGFVDGRNPNWRVYGVLGMLWTRGMQVGAKQQLPCHALLAAMNAGIV